jgi:aerobic carbon-monoxide dehydrogenase medium subunit
MYGADFDYQRAGSIAEARQMLSDTPGAKLLAGGHSLIPLMKLRLAAPSTVIDIGRIAELRGISTTDDGMLRIGALTTHAEIAASADVRRGAPALSEAAGMIGDPTVRNRGTIGGNIAHADPASDLPIVLVALGARMVVVGADGERTVDAADFFLGIMATALGEDEILSAVHVPVAGPGEGSAYVKFHHPASRYAVIGAAAVVTLDAGTCTAVRVAVGGLTPCARRAPGVERSLTGQQASDEAIETAASQLDADLDEVDGDLFASADYRRAVAPVYVRRALAAAVERAGRP